MNLKIASIWIALAFLCISAIAQENIAQSETAVRLNFVAEKPVGTLEKAVRGYNEIWKAEGERIIAAIEKISGIPFEEKSIDVIVYEGISYSGENRNSPMKLRASYTPDVKKATIIHELCHRLLFDHPRASHYIIDLILYDIWEELYGKEFADHQVEVEKKRTGKEDYTTPWNMALSKSKEERQKAFAEYKSGDIISGTSVLGQTTAEDWCIKAIDFGNAGRYKESLEAANESIKLNPDYARAWNIKSYAILGLGKYNESLTAANRSIELDPSVFRPWVNKANALSALGKYNESNAALAKAKELGYNG